MIYDAWIERLMHKEALEGISHYLRAQKDVVSRKLILAATYVDVDFTVLWRYKDKQDPNFVESLLGCIIVIQGCPDICKLQGDITMSTMESEQNALGNSIMRG
jgi:hypothetical protein